MSRVVGPPHVALVSVADCWLVVYVRAVCVAISIVVGYCIVCGHSCGLITIVLIASVVQVSLVYVLSIIIAVIVIEQSTTHLGTSKARIPAISTIIISTISTIPIILVVIIDIFELVVIFENVVDHLFVVRSPQPNLPFPIAVPIPTPKSILDVVLQLFPHLIAHLLCFRLLVELFELLYCFLLRSRVLAVVLCAEK